MYVEQADMSSNAEHSHKKLDVTTCAYASSTVEGLGVDPGWSLDLLGAGRVPTSVRDLVSRKWHEQDTCPHLNTAQGQTCESIAHLCIPHSRHLTITPTHHNRHHTITPTHHSGHRMITPMHENCCWSFWLGFIKKKKSFNEFWHKRKNFLEIQP